jgi:hypothetical protein
MPEGVGYSGVGVGSNARAETQRQDASTRAQGAREQPQTRQEPRQQNPGVDVQISQRGEQAAQANGQGEPQQSDTYADPRGRGRT